MIFAIGGGGIIPRPERASGGVVNPFVSTPLYATENQGATNSNEDWPNKKNPDPTVDENPDLRMPRFLDRIRFKVKTGSGQNTGMQSDLDPQL